MDTSIHDDNAPTAPAKGLIRVPLRQALRVLAEAGQLSEGLTSRDASGRYTIDPGRLSVAAVRTAIAVEMREERFTRYLVAEDDPDLGPRLGWHGAFTAGRSVYVTLDPLLADGRATLQWDSGTGRPSRWIGRALDQAGLGHLCR